MSLLKRAGIAPEDQGDWWEPLEQAAPKSVKDKLRGASYRAVKVHFASDEDVLAFAELIGQHIDGDTRVLWFPTPAQSDELPRSVPEETAP